MWQHLGERLHGRGVLRTERAAFGWACTALYVRAACFTDPSGGDGVGPVATSRRLAAAEQFGGIVGASAGLAVAHFSNWL